MTVSKQPKIRLSGVSRAFDGVRALDNVDLTLAHCQSLVLIGGSGSDESLLLKCILGLVNLGSGAIEVDGVSTIGMSEALWCAVPASEPVRQHADLGERGLSFAQ
jgi:ABC-type transporter Mla maintaining outer membrane lipid asymmetry ATPase subunit MlaF